VVKVEISEEEWEAIITVLRARLRAFERAASLPKQFELDQCARLARLLPNNRQREFLEWIADLEKYPHK